MDKLTAYFKEAGFEEQDLEKIVRAFTLKTYEKDDCFVEEGKHSHYLGFIEYGVFQYYVLSNGEEITTYIGLENTFLASMLSFLHDIPAGENIRALSSSLVCLLNKEHLLSLQDQVKGFKDFYIKLLEWQICCIDKSRLDLLTLSSEQRYDKLLSEEPHLLQQVPLQYLASILGVTPRHLSRIRKNTR